MNFRKLLAFVLVFSLAARPGGVRLLYAQDTKAAEKVKIAEATEANDELALELDEAELDEYLFDPGSRKQKIEEAANVAAEETAATSKTSGALAGAIAAGVAAIAAVVGTLGVMIHNGANNASEIKTLWTSAEDTFLSRLGKTISILFKGSSCRYGESEDGNQCLSNIEISRCKYGEDEESCRCLAEKPANEIASLKDYQQKEAKLQTEEQEQQELPKGTFTAQPYYLYEKKRAQNKINKMKDTFGLDVAGLQNQLNSINLKNVATIDELRAAEESIIKFGKEIESLRNSCKTINSKKGYIENNIQAVVNILDESDVSLDHDWDELKNKPVTEGNLETLAEDYKEIAGRVKAVIDNNNAISTSTGKIRTAIEGNKNLEWFDEAYYNGQLDDISKKAKTEESLPGIKNEVEELAKKLNGVETANKLDGEINELIPEFGNYKLGYKTQYENDYKAKCAELKKEHDASKIIKELEAYKQNIGSQLNKLKTCCENRPEKCGE